MKLKKTVAILLTLIFCVSCFAMPSSALDTGKIEMIECTIDEMNRASAEFDDVELSPSTIVSFYYTNGVQEGWTIVSGAEVQFDFKGESNEANIYVGYIKNGVMSPYQSPDSVSRNIFQSLYRYKTKFLISETGVYQFYVFNATANVFTIIDCTVSF